MVNRNQCMWKNAVVIDAVCAFFFAVAYKYSYDVQGVVDITNAYDLFTLYNLIMRSDIKKIWNMTPCQYLISNKCVEYILNLLY